MRDDLIVKLLFILFLFDTFRTHSKIGFVGYDWCRFATFVFLYIPLGLALDGLAKKYI